MNLNTTIPKLVDYLLLNACSVNSSGLYNGKAGISLCLFEVARFLQDEYIEEQAFRLLQEALLSRNDDVGFENGLSGIGYVLLYLIDNKFIDTDFNEIFAPQWEKIKEKIEKSDGEKLVKYHFRVVFLLDMLSSMGDDYKDAKSFASVFSDTASHLLKENIQAIGKNQDIYIKTEFAAFFETYLKMVVVCRHFPQSNDVLDSYAQLYRQNKLVCSFPTGYYLRKIAKTNKGIHLAEIAEAHCCHALKNIYPQTMMLSQRIDMLYLLRQDEEMFRPQIKLLENDFFENDSGQALEQALLSAIGTNYFLAGYRSGIARFLLYWIYCNINDRNRFIFL